MLVTTGREQSHARPAGSTAGEEPGALPSPIVTTTASDKSGCDLVAGHSHVDLGDSTRLAIMLSPRGQGTVEDQALQALELLTTLLAKQPRGMEVTFQTVFLRNAGDQPLCERIFAGHYGARLPVTNYVHQPPCDGAALAMEVWAIGGEDVRIERFNPSTLSVSYDRVRWVYCAGVDVPGDQPVYGQSMACLERMRRCLEEASSGFEHVVRTWFYLGGITGLEADVERYRELNRARTDFYEHIQFCGSLAHPHVPRGVYPASTGIGMAGTGLVGSCLTLQTPREDVLLLPLENPQQTPAYAYHPKYSAQSPKFSRAMALILGPYTTTWISGTASIVNSESRHLGDIEKQTEQTLDNIAQLISADNFAFHGVPRAGATLTDLAKVRVYVKRPEDYARCRAVCQKRLGAVPSIYALADICRPELLVEIEGVAFSRCKS